MRCSVRKYFTPGISRLYRIRSTVELTIRERGGREREGGRQGGEEREKEGG